MTQRIYVAHIIIGLGIGGAELMLRRLVLAQQPATVISMTTIGPVGRMLQEAGVEVIALGLRAVWDIPRVFWALLRLLRKRRPAVVQTWMVHADLIGGLAARMAGIRAVIWGIRTTEFSGASQGTRLIRWACARLSGHVPAAIACAAEASRRSHEAIGYAPSRMVVIPNGFDIERFKPDPVRRKRVRQQLGLGDDEIVVGHVGRWNLAKDHPNFVRAVSVLQARQSEADLSPSLRFLMVGREVENSNAELMDEIAAGGAAGHFVLLGERSDIPDLLLALDVFCLSSRTEGFPNVVGEAMASGVPCVVTDVGDAALLVGSTGWIVPREDAEALSSALQIAVSESAASRVARAESARQRVVDEFSLERACRRFGELQQQVFDHGAL
jgi:glycosyltransferase involved in cell wall biosynthesis